MRYSSVSLCLLLATAGCSPARSPHTLPVQQTASTAQWATLHKPLHAPVPEKWQAQGQVQLEGKTLTVTLQLPPLPSQQNFALQKLDLEQAAWIVAQVRDTHGKIYLPTAANQQGKVTYPADGQLTLTFENLLLDSLILTSLRVETDNQFIPQADLALVLSQTSTGSRTESINFQTTAVAKTLLKLFTEQPERARSIQLSALNTLMAEITGITGTAPHFSYDHNHPTLVKTEALATALLNQDPEQLQAADYRGQGAIVNLSISGLENGDQLQVNITDAASPVRTALGNDLHSGTIQSLRSTPGANLNVQVRPFGTPANPYSFNVTPETLDLVEGSEQTVIIEAISTAITGLSPTAGQTGSPVVISGTGLTGSNVVEFSGANNTWVTASFTVNNNTQITATIPAEAIDGPIRVTKGARQVLSSAFDVQRIWYVNAAATGNNTGTSWHNAFSHDPDTVNPNGGLQAALASARANDTIWVATGRYTPHLSDQSISFQLKEHVNIYGGFAGHETLLEARNLAENQVILSGDLQNNDTHCTPMPCDNMADNSHTVVKGANNTLLDGVTISHGNSNNDSGGGMRNLLSSPTLRNITFANNAAPSGGGMSNVSNLPLLTNVTFINNHANNNGGGMANSTSSPVLKNVTFTNNTANNQGGGMSNIMGSPQLINVTFANNTAAHSQSGGIFNHSSLPILKNSLFWNSPQENLSPALSHIANAQGNLSLAEAEDLPDPFIDSANPHGPDGIPRTADDGLRISAGATAVINQGVTDTDVPATDILGLDRVGNPEPGAYEYVPPPPPPPLMVKIDATGADNGSSWADAFSGPQGLQKALAAAQPEQSIWVAAGRYTPSISDKNISFQMKAHVSIYGGFAGNESLLSQRNWHENQVILSGDLADNDNHCEPKTCFGTLMFENSQTVVKGAQNALLDGATITRGNKIGGNGGGFFNSSGAPILRNITFSYNFATGNGGGVFNQGETPTLSNVYFLHNVATHGGGIANAGGQMTLTNAAFVENSLSGGGYGPGFYSSSGDHRLTNITFSQNSHSSVYWANGNPTLINVLFWNSVPYSGVNLSPTFGNISLNLANGHPDPFLDSANPWGCDGIPGTADDGLRLKAQLAGVGTPGATSIPWLDILGRQRNTPPSSGAYEYISTDTIGSCIP